MSAKASLLFAIEVSSLIIISFVLNSNFVVISPSDLSSSFSNCSLDRYFLFIVTQT
nr:MAG TPA: hypothetical protein [Caudoviricetes sp.]